MGASLPPASAAASCDSENAPGTDSRAGGCDQAAGACGADWAQLTRERHSEDVEPRRRVMNLCRRPACDAQNLHAHLLPPVTRTSKTWCRPALALQTAAV
jgi:hypothetical protein